jgi:flagellar hook-associated protein 2
MGQITSSVGLISGIDTAAIIEQLVALESRPKTQIEQRNSVLEAQQTAYQTVNAQLLALRSAGSRLVADDAFEATTATSSDETIAEVSSGVGAAVGNYALSVKQLVGSQQTISRGFVDSDATFLAPEGATLTFNRGEARLDRQTLLSELNGGQGVQRGYVRVTDRSGATTVIDLTTAVTLDDVTDAFNRATAVNVIAEVTGDGLTLTDATGQAASDLIVQDVGTAGPNGGTAESLGLVASSSTGTIVGSNINTISEETYLSSLNDGNGLRALTGQPDLNITVAGGGSYDLNLSNAVTLEDLFDTIDTATGGDVTATINPDGTGLLLTDNTGGGAGFAVTALNDSRAGLDLGILGSDDNADGEIVGGRALARLNSKLLRNLNGGEGLVAFGGGAFVTVEPTTNLADLFQGAGLSTTGTGQADLEITPRDGSGPFTVNFDNLTTVQDLIDEVDSDTGGAVTLAIEGNTLVATDNTGGTGELILQDVNGSTAVTELGLSVAAEVASVTGNDLDPDGPVLDATTFTVTNSAGGGGTVDLAGAESIQDVIDAINDAGVGVRASLNFAGTGFALTDTAGGVDPLIVEDDAGGVLATQLGLAGTFEDGQIDSGPLDYQYVHEGSRIDNLGIARGRFTIRDSDGRSSTVDLTQGNEQTIADVLSEINSRGLAINARVNDTGDGLILEDTGSGAVGISVGEDGSTTARDLGLLGDFEAGQNVDGTFQRTIDVTATDTLASLAQKITDADVGVSAAVINDGSPGAPYRLSLNAERAGTGGAFTFDDGGLGFDIQNLAEARDAVVFFGGDDPEDALIVTSKSNTLDTLIPGASISLLGTTERPIQITIGDDPSAVTNAADDFVSSFNGLIDTINEFDRYNAETEERGLLLGDSALARLRTSIYNAIIGANTGLSGQFTSLSQIGITIGSGAQLRLDNEKFQAALANDPEGVRELFTFEQFEVDPETGEATDVLVAQGVGQEIDKLLERLTDGTDGVIERQVQVLADQIQANNRRIEQVDESIENKRANLEREFANLESSLADLQDQQSSLAVLNQLGGQPAG